MSRLSDVISQIIEEQVNAEGALDPARAASSALRVLEEDDIGLLACAELKRCFKKAMEIAGKSAAAASSSQMYFPFPDIRLAHSLDVDNRVIKLTSEMSEMEFSRVIEIREKSIKADAIYLNKLKQARKELAPIWAAQPDLTFAEACEVFVQVGTSLAS